MRKQVTSQTEEKNLQEIFLIESLYCLFLFSFKPGSKKKISWSQSSYEEFMY